MTDEPDKAGRVRQSVVAALLAALLCLSVTAQPQTITGKVVGVNVGLKGKAGANAPAMSLYNDGSLA